VLVNRVPEAVGLLHTFAKREVEQTAEYTAERMRERVAVDTGETRDSIETNEGEVRAGGASVFLEYGTVHMPAQPFFDAAVRAGQRERLRGERVFPL
jgi:hypothetical protein